MTTLELILAVAVNAIAVIGGLAAGSRWLKKWVRETAAAVKTANAQLATSNGHTIGQYVELNTSKLDDINSKVDWIAVELKETRALVDTTVRRLDDHLANHHNANRRRVW